MRTWLSPILDPRAYFYPLLSQHAGLHDGFLCKLLVRLRLLCPRTHASLCHLGPLRGALGDASLATLCARRSVLWFTSRMCWLCP